MADGASITIDGLDKLLAELRQLPDAVSTRVLKGATATACAVIKNEAIRLAPEWSGPVGKNHPPPGTLKRAIYQARLSSKCAPGKEVWVINVRSGKKAQTTRRGKQTINLDAYYAYFVEHGHFVRQKKKFTRLQKKVMAASGKVRYVPPQPFMRPAFESKKGAAREAFAEYLRTQLPLAIKGMSYIKVK